MLILALDNSSVTRRTYMYIRLMEDLNIIFKKFGHLET